MFRWQSLATGQTICIRDGLTTTPHGRWCQTTSGHRAAAALKQRNRTLLLYAGAVMVFFTGASYAAVPLYRIFCQTTGYAGTPRRATSNIFASTQEQPVAGVPATSSSTRQPIRIAFNADVATDLPWKFRPQQKEVYVMPGETALVFYTAQNLSDQDMIGISSYNVIPDKAAAYFNKIQCFCFEDQLLRAHEEIELPILLSIDPAFSSDPHVKDIDRLTLSYTFFLSKDPKV